jgi:ribosomal protein S21
MGVSLKRLKAEIEKCEVLCANCHAKEHYSQMFE